MLREREEEKVFYTDLDHKQTNFAQFLWMIALMLNLFPCIILEFNWTTIFAFFDVIHIHDMLFIMQKGCSEKEIDNMLSQKSKFIFDSFTHYNSWTFMNNIYVLNIVLWNDELLEQMSNKVK